MLVQVEDEWHTLLSHSLMSLQPVGVLMKPAAQTQLPPWQTSPGLQSSSLLQPGWQVESRQISPCKQFLSEWQTFTQTSARHRSPLAQSELMPHCQWHIPPLQVCWGGHWLEGHREGILTQPCWGVGTPANLLGQEHCTFLSKILQRALGPQAPSCEQGLTHLSEGQFSLFLQPTEQTPLLQT